LQASEQGGFGRHRAQRFRLRSGRSRPPHQAAVSAVLTDAGIPCNAVAAYHHDYLFVPWEMAQRALGLLIAVAAAPARIPDQEQPPSHRRHLAHIGAKNNNAK
jgi:hypothetical protein